MDNPCVKECPERTSICHGSCDRYAAYAAWCEQRRRDRRRRVEEQAALNHGKRVGYAIHRYQETHKKE